MQTRSLYVVRKTIVTAGMSGDWTAHTRSALIRDAMFLWGHHIDLSPDDEGRIRSVKMQRLRDVGIEFIFRAEIVILGHDMVNHTFNGEGAFIVGWNAAFHVALLMDHDAGPAQDRRMGRVDDASSILPHTGG